MSPFGALLRYYREVRGISQKDLARQIPIDPKIISAIETGRRQPFGGDELQQLYTALSLSESERQRLDDAALNSAYVIRIPREMSPMDLQLVHRLVKSLKILGSDKKMAIQNLIEGRSCQ